MCVQPTILAPAKGFSPWARFLSEIRADMSVKEQRIWARSELAVSLIPAPAYSAGWRCWDDDKRGWVLIEKSKIFVSRDYKQTSSSSLNNTTTEEHQSVTWIFPSSSSFYDFIYRGQNSELSQFSKLIKMEGKFYLSLERKGAKLANEWILTYQTKMILPHFSIHVFLLYSVILISLLPPHI